MRYTCEPGFTVVGRGSILCQGDGTWTRSELPTCIPVQCHVPSSPVNGNVVYTALAYKVEKENISCPNLPESFSLRLFQSVVSYKCNYGFMLLGNGTRTCGADQTWTGEDPTCVEINCGLPGPDGSGRIPNGWIEHGRTTLNAVITFRYKNINYKIVVN